MLILTIIYIKVKVKVLGLSLHSGMPVLPTVHITPWIIGPFHSTDVTLSVLRGGSLAHSYMIVHYPTRYHLFTSMVRSDRPDKYSSSQCVVRYKPRTPHHTDCPARESNPRPSGQCSTGTPLTIRLTRTTKFFLFKNSVCTLHYLPFLLGRNK